MVCRSGPVMAISFAASSIKPWASISSTSSSTRNLTPPKSVLPFSIWSSSRPGVPISTWALPASLFFWVSKSRPPMTASVEISSPSSTCFITSLTCWASSRVGVMTNACTYFLAGSIFWARGIRKASVLPVPVWARASTSRPFSRAGIACCCTGMGVLIPIFCKFSLTLGSMFICSKKVLIFYLKILH